MQFNSDLVVPWVSVLLCALLLTPLGRLLGFYSGEGLDGRLPGWFRKHYGRPTLRLDITMAAFFGLMSWVAFMSPHPWMVWPARVNALFCVAFASSAVFRRSRAASSPAGE